MVLPLNGGYGVCAGVCACVFVHVCLCECVFVCVCLCVCIWICALHGDQEVNYTVLSHQPQGGLTGIRAVIPSGTVRPVARLSVTPLSGLKPVVTRPRVQPNALRRYEKRRSAPSTLRSWLLQIKMPDMFGCRCHHLNKNTLGRTYIAHITSYIKKKMVKNVLANYGQYY